MLGVEVGYREEEGGEEEGEGEGRAGAKRQRRLWDAQTKQLGINSVSQTAGAFYILAIEKWADTKKHRPATYGGGRRQQSESVMVQMDEDSDKEPLRTQNDMGNKQRGSAEHVPKYAPSVRPLAPASSNWHNFSSKV
eukprot:1159749-Pelagomonas_calceolata.AAC.2